MPVSSESTHALFSFEMDGRTVTAGTGGAPLDPQRPALVLVHGAGGDHTVWSEVVSPLVAAGWSVLALDLPGHGGSDGPTPDTVVGFADWLDAAIDAAGVASVAVAGHSLGSYIALDLAARYAERVTRLVLLGTTDRIAVRSTLLDAARNDLPLAADLMSRWSMPRSVSDDPDAERIADDMRRTILRTGPGVLFADLTAVNAYDTAPASAGRVRCPMLFVLGDGDRMTSSEAATGLIESSTDARVVLLPGAGHMMMLERPDAVAGAIREFLEQP